MHLREENCIIFWKISTDFNYHNGSAWKPQVTAEHSILSQITHKTLQEELGNSSFFANHCIADDGRTVLEAHATVRQITVLIWMEYCSPVTLCLKRRRDWVSRHCTSDNSESANDHPKLKADLHQLLLSSVIDNMHELTKLDFLDLKPSLKSTGNFSLAPAMSRNLIPSAVWATACDGQKKELLISFCVAKINTKQCLLNSYSRRWSALQWKANLLYIFVDLEWPVEAAVFSEWSAATCGI